MSSVTDLTQSVVDLKDAMVDNTAKTSENTAEISRLVALILAFPNVDPAIAQAAADIEVEVGHIKANTDSLHTSVVGSQGSVPSTSTPSVVPGP